MGDYEPAVRVVELDSGRNWIRQTNLDFGRGTKDWTKKNTSIRTGSNTAYLLVYANIYNSYGMFWVDDIDLREKVSTSTSTPPSTPIPTPVTIPTTGAVYYVSNNGNNGNSGSLTSPWKTISYAVGGQSPVIFGDTVVVKAGTYNEQVDIKVGGTSSTSKVTLMANPGEHVDISCKGLGLTGWTGCVQAWKTNYITIQGLHIQDSDTWGILLYGDIYGVTIDSNIINNVYHSGIMAERPWNLMVSRNEIYEVSHDEQWEGISIIAGHGTIIKDNHIHNVHNIGIDLKEGAWDSIVEGNYVHDLPPCPSYCGNGIYIDARGNAENNIITRNKIANVALFGIVLSSETDGTLRKTIISNNIISNSELDGIGVGVYTTTNNVYIYDTTIVDNVVYGGTSGGIQLGQDSKIKVSGTIIRNNIVAYAPDFQIAVRPQVTSTTIDHNLIYPYRGTDSSETRGTSYIESDPKFINPSALDFHLLSTSPAIDKGSPTNAPPIDYYGNSRPQGNGYDIGAIEYIQ